MPKRRINLCIADEKWQRLKQYAERNRISASAAVDQALDRILDDEEQRRQVRLQAYEELLRVELGPLGTWEEMEAEIASERARCLDGEQP